MTASNHPHIDPQRDAASLFDAPEDAAETAGDSELAELFGELLVEPEPAPRADDAASREHLAALFGQPVVEAEEQPAPVDVISPEDPDAASREQLAALFGQPVARAEEPPAPEDEVKPEHLGALFGEPPVKAEMPPEPDNVTHSEHLGALFGESGDSPAAETPEADPAVWWEPQPVFDDQSVPVPEPESVQVTEPEPEPVEVTEPEPESASGSEPVTERLSSEEPELPTEQDKVDPMALLARQDEPVPEVPEKLDPMALLVLAGQRESAARDKGDLHSRLGVAGSDATSQIPASATSKNWDETPAAIAPAPHRGLRAWSRRTRWSVAASVLLVAGLTTGSLVVAQNVAANNDLAAERLSTAVALLEGAETSATDPESALDEAVTLYGDTVESARATADSAAPALAAVAGMTPQPELDAANAALAALVAQIDASELDDPPQPYERGDVEMSDIRQVKLATRSADDHAELVIGALRETGDAQAALQQKLDALRTAQLALGASLPGNAKLIVDEKARAPKNLRDAVTAAAAAVGAAQNAGGSGDAELLAYAGAVTALRADETRDSREVTPVTPPTRTTPRTGPGTTPAPAPAPDPAPAPEPPPVPDPVPPTPPEPVPPTPPAPEPPTPPVEPTP